MKAVVFLIASGAFWATAPVFAQNPTLTHDPSVTPDPAVPPVLRIFREDIKEGKGAAHEKTEAVFMQTAAKDKYPSHILGMASITGTAQAVFLEGHDTIGSIADSQAFMDRPEFATIDAADAEMRTTQRSMIAVYRPELSFGADKINLAKMRFFNIETIRIREGQGRRFGEFAKTLAAGAAKSGDDQAVATYEIVSGAPGGTYLLLAPMESLKSLDEGPKRERALLQAAGMGQLDYDHQKSETIASEESILFAVNPTMSYIPKEWVTVSPDFWKSAAK